MSTYQKVFLIVSAMLLMLSLSIIALVSVNFKEFGLKNAKERAELTAEAVRDGLTSHMVNGTMDKRYFFLDNMSRHQKIKNLQVFRSEKVIEQFGKGLDTGKVEDDVDKSVLVSGVSQHKLIANGDGRQLRVVIPYIATVYSKPNCLECHTNSKEGDVLGAISMEVDIGGIENEGIFIIAKTLGVSLLFLLIAILIAHYAISPYIRLFDDLEDGIRRVYQGDYSFEIKTKLKSQAGLLARKLNELADIYRFKKTIEMDKSKSEVFKRLIYVFEEKLEIKQLAVFEVDHIKNLQKLIYSSVSDFDCKHNCDPQKCRAMRTGRIIISTDFPELCEVCGRDGGEYICIPFRINASTSLILHIMSDDPAEITRLQKALPVIRNYLNIAMPVIESKILMEILEEASYKDGLTELYNRRYLNSMLDDNHFVGYSQVAVLMVDIDFFKEVNDTYGHDVGDSVIRGLSKVLKNHVGLQDYAVRFGGEEFVLLLPGCSDLEAEQRAQSVREQFAKLKFDVTGKSFSKTLSVGVAVHPTDGETIWKSIKYADVALYRAKESGRNRVVRFKSEYFKEDEY